MSDQHNVAPIGDETLATVESTARMFAAISTDRVRRDDHLLTLALIARLRAAEARQQWRPISEAPRDGTWMLTSDPVHGMRVAGLMTAIEDGDEQWVYARTLGSSAVAFICHPTHWLPLPPPPEGAA